MKRRKPAKIGGNATAVSSRKKITGGGDRAAPLSAQFDGASSAWTNALALAAIAIAALAAYGNTFGGPLIFDDRAWVLNNPSISRLWPIWRLLAPSHAELVGGRPVVSLTLAVNYALGGLNVWGYHAVNLAIHVLAAWTLFGVVRRTLSLPGLRARFGSAAAPLALAAALLWMMHPLQTESVTYIIQRTEALMGLFYLLTLYCVIRGATSGRSILWYAAAVAACLLGMATKEVMATAPLIVLLYDRTFLAGSFREAWRRRYGLYLSLAATWGVLVLLLISTGFYGGTTGFAVQKFTWWSYLLTQSGVIVRYLQLAFWPVGLCLDYNWPPAHAIGQIVVPGIMVVGLVGLTFWALAKRPAWGFLGAWFFVILAPSSSIVPIKDAAFEHRMYLSLAALATGAVVGGWVGGQWAANRLRLSRWTLQATSVCLAALAAVSLGILAFQRNADYRDEMSIWEDTLTKVPGNARAHTNLGLCLTKCGRVDEAIVEYHKALELNPNEGEAHNNLGNALARRRQFDEAIGHLRRAVEITPNYSRAFKNLGLALHESGNDAEALAHLQRAMELEPQTAECHYDLANTLATLGRFDEMAAEYRRALEIDPDYAEAHNNFGAVLFGRGQLDEAIAELQAALNLKPDYTDARNNLGLAQSRREEIRKTLIRRREALRQRPDDPVLLNETAWMLATNPNASIRNGAEAVELAGRAVRLTGGGEPAVLGTLAAAYAAAGRFSEAQDTARKALDLAARQDNHPLAESIKAKIPLYEAGTSFREISQPAAAGSTPP